MNTLARVVSFGSAVVVVCFVSGIFLWHYGARGLWLPPCAAIGALIAMMISQALFSNVMMGVASIAGGAIGGMSIGSAVSPCIRLDTPTAPHVVCSGAVIGAAIWIIRLSIPAFNKECGLQNPEEEGQHETLRRDRTSDFLWISLVLQRRVDIA